MAATHIKLLVCGSEFYLTTSESEQYMKDLASRLEATINEYTAGNYGLSMSKASILAALGYLDELERSKQGADNMRSQLQTYLDDAAKGRLRVRELQEENARLREENEEIRRQLDQVMSDLGLGAIGK